MRRYFTPSLGVILCGLSVLFLHHGNYWSAHWASKWAILIMSFSIAMSFYVGKKINWIWGLTIGYLLLNAACVAVWPQNMYVAKLDTLSLIAIEKNALYAYLVVLSLAISFLAFKKTWRPGSTTVLVFVPIVSIITTLFHAKDAVKDGFYSGNPSMNGCLIAALLPFLFVNSWWTFGALIFGWSAIFLTKASIPVGVYAVMLGAYLLALLKPSHKTFGKMAFVSIGVILAGSFYLGDQLFEDSGRFHVWEEIWNYWKQDPRSIVLGTGLGSLQILTPTIQSINTPASPLELFLWLHNDWLQILIETGFVGLLGVVCCWVTLVRKSFGSPKLFSSLCAFSAMALFNYPLRLPIHSFCLFLVVCLIWNEPTHRMNGLRGGV